MAADLLSLLANKSNRSILGLLAVEPAWPRKVGQLVSLSETEVSRRLKRMEDLGLVVGEWVHVGKNVKQYRLAARGAEIHFTNEGVELRLEPLDGTARPTDVIPTLAQTIPHVEGFVGRQETLDAIGERPGVLLVEGLPGIGKTSLLAMWAQTQDRPLFWHTFRGVESLRWLANRMALHHARHGERRWLDLLGGELEAPDLQEIVVEMVDRPGSVHILDDVHHVDDPTLRASLGAAIERTTEGKLILSSREPIKHAPTLTNVRVLRMEGLSDDDVARFLEQKDVRVAPKLLPRIRDEVGGHPLALNLLIEAAERLDVTVEDLLDRIPEKEVEEYLLQEVYEGLREDERQVLTQSSIFRTTFSIDDLRTITTKDPERALVRLRRRLLVHADEDGYTLHEVVRNFFYKQLSDKARLHEKVAARYLSEDTPESRLEAMHHYLAAERRDKVLDLLEADLDLRAFDFLDVGYHRLYREILDSFTRKDVPDPLRWAVIEDDRGDLAYHEGAYEAALRHYDQAERTFREHDRKDRLADLAWKRGLILQQLGQRDAARAAVEAGLGRADEGSIGRRRLDELRQALG